MLQNDCFLLQFALQFARNDRISESLISVIMCTVYVVITCLLHTIALFVHSYSYT